VQKQRFINLTFHGIGVPGRSLHDGEDSVWVSEARFTSVLDAVAGRDDVRITFDDGNISDLELALPALRERGLTATFFVIADRLDVPEFLAPKDLQTLIDAGMTIGCHGMRHRHWRALGEDGLQEELVDARRVLESAAGSPVTAAACPFGSYGRHSLRALERAGYTRVYTSDRGLTHAGEWLQARTTITEHGALEPILNPEPSPYGALRRRLKLTAKRWR
jgi:peptidoglycan/xylan/chitin deacetylase (PgdA/CDA1 family)